MVDIIEMVQATYFGILGCGRLKACDLQLPGFSVVLWKNGLTYRNAWVVSYVSPEA